MVCSQTSNPIQLHPDNQRYFSFRGKPTILITSAEHYGAVINLDFDFKIYLDELARNGLNYTRIFSGAYVEIPGAFNISKNTLAPKPDKFLAPWRRSAEPGYFTGGNKFDLNAWDEAYFERLKEFVTEAGKRHIIVEMTFFSSLYGDNGWLASPLHPKNNLSQIKDLPRQKVQTLDNGNLLRYQESMVRKIVQELNSYDNLFYEIQNEPWADNGSMAGQVNPGVPKPEEWQKKVEIANTASLAWQQHLAKLIVQEESALPNKHLVAQNISNFVHQIQNPDPNISIFNFHYALPAAVTLNLKLKKAIGFDESGFSGNADSTYRQQAWNFIMAGGSLFNNLDYSFSVEKENGTDVQSAPGGGSPALRGQLKILKEFIYSFDFIRMHPADDLIKIADGSKALVLAIPGEQYAVYFSEGESKSFEMAVPNGNYQLQWLNPVTGTFKSSIVKSKQGKIKLIIPVHETDIALKVIRKT